MRWIDRLSGLIQRRQMDRDLEEEIDFHLAMKSRDQQAAGLPAEDARLAALRRFGNLSIYKEHTRETWGWGWAERFGQDLRYAVRVLRKNRAFSLVAMLTLATGIGANTAIFTVVHAVLLAPLPYPEPARLVRVLGQKPKWGFGISGPDVADFRVRNTVFEGVAYSVFQQASVLRPGEPERVDGCLASANLLAVLGVQPLLGRGMDAADEQPGAPPVIILSYPLWRRLFAGSPEALGKTIQMDRSLRTVVGVMPPWFHYPDEEVQYWVPVSEAPFARNRNIHTFSAVARLRPGVSLERARNEVKTIAARLEQAYPKENAGWSATVVELADQISGGVRKPLLILLGAVGLILLMACANVANLLLSRGAQRSHEIAVRMALGAPRLRLVRLLFTESLLLSTCGGALGILFALWGLRALAPLYPAILPRASEIHVDPTALAFAALVSIGSAVLAGLAPAFRGASGGLNVRNRALRTGRSRSALVIAQISLAMVLVACAGLLVKSFLLRIRISGFNPDDVLIAQLPELPEGHLPAILERIRSLPGVRSAASATSLTYTRAMGTHIVSPGKADDDEGIVEFEVVTADYFQTLRIPIRQGRAIDSRDNSGGEPTAVISEALARRYFPDVNPLGKQIALGSRRHQTMAAIVGVAGDVPAFGDELQAEPVLYLASQPTGFAGDFQPDTIVIRSSAPPSEVAPSVRAVVRAMEPAAPIVRLQPMQDDLSSMVASPRFYSLLLGLFAAFALLLAAGGVYGVMSFAVTARTHEIGIRMALGASRAKVLGSVLRAGTQMAATGAVVGGGAALAAARLLIHTNLLFGVKASDPLTFAITPTVLLASALAACWFPARRATRIDPAVSLRDG